MNTKQKWLLERLLIPAGILPPALKYSDLRYNEELRSRIGCLGIEYFYILKQDPHKINDSAIGGKTYAVHAPWPEFEHHAISNPLIHKLANLVLFGGQKTNADFSEMATRTFEFSKKIGAKVATFHIEFLDHEEIVENLATLDKLSQESGIVCAMEHDGAYIPKLVNRGRKYLKVDGSYDWMMDPVKMIKELDKLYPRRKFGICFDTTALIGCELPIIETTKKVVSRIAHVHLAGSEIGEDLASEIDSPEIAEVVNILYENKYKGYITAEVNGSVGIDEQRLALFHGMSSVFGINILKDKVAGNAMRHIKKSCDYLIDYLKKSF